MNCAWNRCMVWLAVEITAITYGLAMDGIRVSFFSHNPAIRCVA
ncbi:hypothetical protein [Laceyella putida]|uniref:Uncharacterized protein n=1 Tax=Laceyella putida TaxID=110101 RepID=A0ABW2RGY0_9BACL